jgi:general secretion pathway protein H
LAIKHRLGRGFTLLELMVVIAIVAIASVGVAMSMPDPTRSQLNKEAVRLAALLDTARAYSRASGIPVVWQPTNAGFAFSGLSKSAATLLAAESHWLNTEVRTTSNLPLVLGPEPVIGAQAVTLMLGTHRARVASDGLRPFGIADESAANPPAKDGP